MKKSLFYITALVLLSCTLVQAAPRARRVGSTAGGANGVSPSSTNGVPNNFTVARPRYNRGSNYYYGLGGNGYRGGGYGSPAPTSDETFKNSTKNKIPGYEARPDRDAYPSLKSYGSSSDRVLNTYNR